MAPLDVMPLRPAYEHIPSHVPVFDPDKVMLSLVPSALLESSEYSILTFPQFPGDFDVYGSDERNPKNKFAIVTRFDDDVDGKSFVARIHYGTLGWWQAGLKRIVSRKYRELWIGAMPPCIALVSLVA